jgi:hypothetical protein
MKLIKDHINIKSHQKFLVFIALDMEVMFETFEKFIVALINITITLQFSSFIILDDFLIVMILQFLHEVLVFLDESL